MSEQLIGLLGRGRRVTEWSDIVGETFARKVAVNRRELIEFCLYGTALPDLYHLTQLLIADEYLVYF
jgi:hypothetical protein